MVQDTKVEEMEKKMKNKLTVTKNVWMEKKIQQWSGKNGRRGEIRKSKAAPAACAC